MATGRASEGAAYALSRRLAIGSSEAVVPCGDPLEELGRIINFDSFRPTLTANTIRLYRDKLVEVGALDTLSTDINKQLKERGFLSMGVQIVEATLGADIMIGKKIES